MEMVYGELQSAFFALVTGIFLRALYTGICMKRAVFGAGKFVRWIEDVLYWLAAAGVLFAMWQTWFLGESRGYGYLAVALGMYLWYKGPESLLLKVFVKCVAEPLKKIRKRIKLKVKMRREEVRFRGSEDESKSKSA